ncbi:MAG: 4-hydroxythreonine-4-phosphate dehydrogenase PdxA [Verrucomicrobia bacterium]|nr:4-hydroxythreonine-4-phosphate dehydrogenase PdxA [Verrucomicrobiota bacterium]
MPKPFAITIGDPTGIGPEVALKALAREWPADSSRYVLLGDAPTLLNLNRRLGLHLPLHPESNAPPDARLTIASPGPPLPDPASLPPGAPQAAQSAVAALREGTRRCLEGQAAALVTAPVNKHAIIRSGQPFVGQTEFLSGLAGSPNPVMMLLGTDDRGRWLRVALVTTHLPLRDVAEHVTPGKISRAIDLATQACRHLGLPRQRVAVCGLNPHAGEGGEMGTEELTCIGPVVQTARARGLDVTGPLAADTLFHLAAQGHFDAVVAMYHDQGLAPLKLVAFDTGVNWTLGLPFIRTSPDHGTAYDIAGRNIASPSSMLSALHLAKQLAGRP